jgi:hypothetical protein
MSIAKAYQGATVVDCPPLAGFGEWSMWVREPLIWLGCEDPVACMDQARAVDPERAAARELLDHWRERIGLGVVVNVRRIIRIADEGPPEFGTFLREHVGNSTEVIDPVRLGRWLQQQHGKVYDGHRIDVVTHRGRSNHYVLVQC